MAALKDGSIAFSTGWAYEGDCVTFAYDTETGAIKWSATTPACGYPLGSYNLSRIEVSPFGDRVLVKANGRQPDGNNIMTLIAYDSESGAELWQSQPLPDHGNNREFVVSESGEVLIITGNTTGESVSPGECSARYLRPRVPEPSLLLNH